MRRGEKQQFIRLDSSTNVDSLGKIAIRRIPSGIFGRHFSFSRARIKNVEKSVSKSRLDQTTREINSGSNLLTDARGRSRISFPPFLK